MGARWPSFWAACLVVAGCGGSGGGASDPAPTGAPAASTAAYADLAIDGALDDGQAAALLLATNDTIAHEGNVGASRGQSGDVQAYAQQTVTDATNANDEAGAVLSRAGIVLEDCAASTRLRGADLEALGALQAAASADFDRTFVDLRVDATTKLLAAIDGAVLPNVKSEGLASYARDVRAMLASQLDGLGRLRSELTQPSR